MDKHFKDSVVGLIFLLGKVILFTIGLLITIPIVSLISNATGDFTYEIAYCIRVDNVCSGYIEELDEYIDYFLYERYVED